MNDPSKSHQVIIVGAGPVGLALALALGRAGIHSQVLERKQVPAPESRATLITPGALEFLEQLGVLPEILAEGERNDAIRILRSDDRTPLLTFDFSRFASETKTPFVVALSQDRTETILRDACAARTEISLNFGVDITDIDEDETDVFARTAAGEMFRGRFLVGADGANSTVRSTLGWSLEGKTYPTRAALGDVVIHEDFDTRAGWLIDPKASSFVLAIRFATGTWRIIDAAIGDDVTDADLPDRFRIATQNLFGKGAWRKTLWTSAYRKHERRCPRYVKGRIALAGDAAHLNSPAGGQGLNAGFADAAYLAQQLTLALAHPAGADAALAEYEAHRTSRFDTEIRGLTDALERMESAPAWMRRLGFSMVGLLRLFGLERAAARKLSMLDAG